MRLTRLQANGKRTRVGLRPMNSCSPLQGAGPGAEGSLSAAAALFSQSENIPEVSPRGAVARAPAQRSRPSTPGPPAGAGRLRLTAVSPPGRQARRCWCGRGRRWDSPSRCSAAAPAQPPLRSPPAPPLRTRFPAPLPPSPGRAALGLCLYLTKTVSRGRRAMAAARWRRGRVTRRACGAVWGGRCVRERARASARAGAGLSQGRGACVTHGGRASAPPEDGGRALGARCRVAMGTRAKVGRAPRERAKGAAAVRVLRRSQWLLAWPRRPEVGRSRRSRSLAVGRAGATVPVFQRWQPGEARWEKSAPGRELGEERARTPARQLQHGRSPAVSGDKLPAAEGEGLCLCCFLPSGFPCPSPSSCQDGGLPGSSS